MVYLSLGSNLGDRVRNLESALAALAAASFTVEARSSLYETAPRDIVDQPWFVNMCAAGTTLLSPFELLALTRGIEAALGRRRDVPIVCGGPRLLDIDILFYGEQVIETPELTIPHPRMLSRRFVLEPLLEIAPHLVHPQTHRPLHEYLPGVFAQETRRIS